ncbi:unnamed protein product [Prunus armeniaca]
MESFPCNIATKVLERLASRAHKEIHWSKDVKGELNKFHETLLTITKVLQYAEENHMANPLLLADCFRKLQDVCYDMDDVLDEYEYKNLRMQVLKPKGSMKEKFNLSERAADLHGMHTERKTSSFVDSTDVIGRDNNKKEMLNHLLKDTYTGEGDDEEENVSIISINGLGGLGKTTLAKLVLLLEIVTAATKETCEDESIEEMSMKLQHSLKNKKILLVLDDVWDKKPMGITEEEGNHPKLVEIGEDIVKKCGGVPLALYTIGGLLKPNKDERYWSHVRDTDIWKLEQESKSILPALKLSYDALPVYLKPCFAFCSLFPKDYIFRSEDLIPLWMAQGFVRSSQEHGNQELEDIGQRYIRQLCSRYFFQIVE